LVNSLFGIETEYGIAVEGAGAGDLIEESRQVVKAFAGRFAAPWNYSQENPRGDVRGFQVENLSQDSIDAQFDSPKSRATSPTEDRCDRVLVNGARLYNDHGHPEYATPECADLRTLVAHDAAGERIVLECAQRHSQDSGKAVSIFKNNTDFHGASYGTHESYLLQRGVSWDAVVRSLAPFLATRIIYAGAGKVGCEEKNSQAEFQISQRADFFQVLQSVDTLANRPLVNTRDEPHGDASRWRRLHVIAGDANMSHTATALRVGATNIVASLIEAGWRAPVALRNPVTAIKHISRDASYKWLVETETGERAGAIEIQRLYLRAAQQAQFPGTEWILAEWEEILDALESNPMSLADRLDWVAKKSLLDEFVEAENLDWTRDALTLQSLDLAYCNADESESLYGGLVEAGAMRTLVSDDEIEAARCDAPANTRAALRSILVRRFADKVRAVSWGGFVFGEGNETIGVELPENADFAALAAQLESASSVVDVAAILRSP
jgi:proteasome accessory factor A